MRRALIPVALVLLAPFAGGWELLRAPDADVERGAELFAAGDFAGAADAFRRGLERRGDEPAIHFNLGAALYEDAVRKIGGERESRFALAERSFLIATDAGDSALRVNAFYNLGNTYYQMGRFADAVAAYRRVLRLRPGDRNARHNLELALRALRDKGRNRGRVPEANGAPPGEAGADPGRQGPVGAAVAQEQNPAGRPGDDPEAEAPESKGPDPRASRDEAGGDGGRRPGVEADEAERPGEAPSEQQQAPSGRDEAEPGMPPAQFVSRSDRDRKLDELERRSRRARTQRLRTRARKTVREAGARDW